MEAEMFRFADALGPSKIIHVYEPSVGLKAVLVVDNVAKGPSLGGVRMAADVSTEECVRLARAMTLKNAAADLPHGGGKAVLFGDPKMPKPQKAQLLRAMAQSLRNVEEYIFAPDMGTDEECMAWVRDEIARVVALPRELGGIPLDEIGATGWGLSHVADVAVNYCDLRLAGARVAIQGFGAVGKHAARFLNQRGAVIVAVSDSQGTIHNADGLDVGALLAHKALGKSVAAFAGGKPMSCDALIDIACDVWIPGARPDVIHEDNVHRLKAKLVIEAANIPITAAAEKILAAKGVLYVPDFIANAGGVICAAMEYQGANEASVFAAIEEKLRRNTEQVLQRVKRESLPPRQAAVELAVERVKKAMSFRRYSLFSTAPHCV
jgi:glutamate dehydrogenase (NAD(P)+)